MLHQPRVPPTGQRQAVEIQIKWREVLAQKQALLGILTKTTGHSMEKLDKVCNWTQYLIGWGSFKCCQLLRTRGTSLLRQHYILEDRNTTQPTWHD